MRKQLLPLLALAALTACSGLSHQDRIASLIREDLSKKLIDFTGYEALSTQVGDSVFASAKFAPEAFDLAKEITLRQEKIEEVQRELETSEKLLATSGLEGFSKEVQYHKEKLGDLQGQIDSLKGEIRKVDAALPHTFLGYLTTHRCRFGKEDHKQILDLLYILDDATGAINFTAVLDDEFETQEKIIDEALSQR